MRSRLKGWFFGPPRNVRDPGIFHRLSLATLFAWIGLGADGLSSSAYGPDQAFRHLEGHIGLAALLAAATAATVAIISYAYTKIVEQFPAGGGGYLVATTTLGPTWGLLSGSALVIDYMLTITVSLASGADAVFSFLPRSWVAYKLLVELVALVLLIVLNLRGVKESIAVLAPIFVGFLIMHALVLTGTFARNVPELPALSREVATSVRSTIGALGTAGTIKLFVRAYSLGGGTYTGIEAVSNGVGSMREPRVQTAKRTMALMAVSLAFTAGGILICYLLVRAAPVEGKTLNAVLFERFVESTSLRDSPLGRGFVIVCLVSEGMLLLVAAQTGFVDGPRVMANMAIDSWLPHRLAALSERLSMQNGVLLMGTASLLALLYTRGDVSMLVVMYSINVFVTFSLSQLGMARFWIHKKGQQTGWLGQLAVHVVAFVLCATILVVTLLEKFASGGWVTVLATGVFVALCSLIRRHYSLVRAALQRLDVDLPALAEPGSSMPPGPNADPVAVLFVERYGGLGRHMLLGLVQMFPGYFHEVIFVSIAVIDSEVFRHPDGIRLLEDRTRRDLVLYERFGQNLGLRTSTRLSVATEVAVEAQTLAVELHRDYARALFVAGQLIFGEENFWNRILHNETAFVVQRRLEHAGVPMIVLPVRVELRRVPQF